MLGIRVQHFTVAACRWDAETIIAPDDRREIADDEQETFAVVGTSQERKDARIAVVAGDPTETVRVEIALMQLGPRAVRGVKVANQRLHTPVLRMIQEMPRQRLIVIPFRGLRELIPHEQELLPW